MPLSTLLGISPYLNYSENSDGEKVFESSDAERLLAIIWAGEQERHYESKPLDLQIYSSRSK
jgi:hypothetical protein